jgi:hypothetical protein
MKDYFKKLLINKEYTLLYNGMSSEILLKNIIDNNEEYEEPEYILEYTILSEKSDRIYSVITNDYTELKPIQVCNDTGEKVDKVEKLSSDMLVYTDNGFIKKGESLVDWLNKLSSKDLYTIKIKSHGSLVSTHDEYYGHILRIIARTDFEPYMIFRRYNENESIDIQLSDISSIKKDYLDKNRPGDVFPLKISINNDVLYEFILGNDFEQDTVTAKIEEIHIDKDKQYLCLRDENYRVMNLEFKSIVKFYEKN